MRFLCLSQSLYAAGWNSPLHRLWYRKGNAWIAWIAVMTEWHTVSHMQARLQTHYYTNFVGLRWLIVQVDCTEQVLSSSQETFWMSPFRKQWNNGCCHCFHNLPHQQNGRLYCKNLIYCTQLPGASWVWILLPLVTAKQTFWLSYCNSCCWKKPVWWKAGLVKEPLCLYATD